VSAERSKFHSPIRWRGITVRAVMGRRVKLAGGIWSRFRRLRVDWCAGVCGVLQDALIA
jgi:hypothetical protein